MSQDHEAGMGAENDVPADLEELLYRRPEVAKQLDKVALCLVLEYCQALYLYTLGRWDASSVTGRGVKPGRKRFDIAEGIEHCWESGLPAECGDKPLFILNKRFWVLATAAATCLAQEGNDGGRRRGRGAVKHEAPKFAEPSALTGGKEPLLELAEVMLRVIESQPWRGTLVSHMLRNALQGSADEQSDQRDALCWGIWRILVNCFPYTTVFALHQLRPKNTKFIKQNAFWAFPFARGL